MDGAARKCAANIRSREPAPPLLRTYLLIVSQSGAQRERLTNAYPTAGAAPRRTRTPIKHRMNIE